MILVFITPARCISRQKKSGCCSPGEVSYQDGKKGNSSSAELARQRLRQFLPQHASLHPPAGRGVPNNWTSTSVSTRAGAPQQRWREEAPDAGRSVRPETKGGKAAKVNAAASSKLHEALFQISQQLSKSVESETAQETGRDRHKDLQAQGGTSKAMHNASNNQTSSRSPPGPGNVFENVDFDDICDGDEERNSQEVQRQESHSRRSINDNIQHTKTGADRECISDSEEEADADVAIKHAVAAHVTQPPPVKAAKQRSMTPSKRKALAHQVVQNIVEAARDGAADKGNGKVKKGGSSARPRGSGENQFVCTCLRACMYVCVYALCMCVYMIADKANGKAKQAGSASAWFW
jgi:hypothetical protein